MLGLCGANNSGDDGPHSLDSIMLLCDTSRQPRLIIPGASSPLKTRAMPL